MYQRFLNNADYMSQISDEHFNQLIRGKEVRVSQAEEAAEASMLEYLTDNYEIEQALETGKRLREYSRAITYPVGAHFYYNGQIVEAMRSINGYKAPSEVQYWKEIEEYDESDRIKASRYTQLGNYHPSDKVMFSGTLYECLEHNGIDYGEIRIPGVNAWGLVEAYEWTPNLEYGLWEVAKWNGQFFALINLEGVDWSVNPMDSDNWGKIGDYDPEYNYELSDTEYVVYKNSVYYPVVNPMADDMVEKYNFRYHDPRNGNVKKHMVRLALFELHKLISPNNVSSARIADYEATMQWLHDANRCKINPMIPRKLDEEKKPVSEIAVATFQRDYDPNKNPWQI